MARWKSCASETSEFDVIQYLKTPIDAATMARLIDLVGEPPATFIRKDRNFKALGLDASDYTTRGRSGGASCKSTRS